MMTTLKPDTQNANKGTERGRALLDQSIQDLGAGRSILTDKDGNVIAGNKTLAAAQKAGLKIRVVETQCDELVVVQRQDLDLSDPVGPARRLAYMDNRVAELDLAWDAQQLETDLQVGMDFGSLGFLDKELQALLIDLSADERFAADEDVEAKLLTKADELQKKWQVQLGQIWQLGNHRLMCGDCTDAAHVARLVGTRRAALCWTDPPWNVNYGGADHPSWKKRGMENDNLGDKFPTFVRDFVKVIWGVCEAGAPLYLVMGAQEWPVIDAALRDAGFHWSSTIIWVKDQLVLSRKDYHTQYEPMWYGWRGDAARTRQVVDRKQSDVWTIDRPKRSEDHPTMKPVELIVRSLENSSLPGDAVFEPFSGSGSTIVACEQKGRHCLALEKDPKYVAVDLERWSILTGQNPVLVDYMY